MVDVSSNVKNTFKGTVINRTCLSTIGQSVEITSTVPLRK